MYICSSVHLFYDTKRVHIRLGCAVYCTVCWINCKCMGPCVVLLFDMGNKDVIVFVLFLFSFFYFSNDIVDIRATLNV